MPRSSICPFKAKPYLRLRTQATGKQMEDPHYQLFTCLKAALLRDRERDDSRGALPEDVEALLAKSLFD